MFSFNTDSGEIFLYDEIGPAWWGLIDASTVINALDQMDGKRVTLRLKTPGGSVDEGVAIFHRKSTRQHLWKAPRQRVD